MSQNKKKNTKSQRADSHDITGIVLIIISGFLLTCLIFTPFLSDISLAIKKVILGTVGFSAYPALVCSLLLGVFIFRKRQNVVGKKRTTLIVTISLLGLCILHLITAGKLNNLPIGDYVSGVYDFEENATAGGLLFGLLTYGILSVITTVGAYIFFALLFALFSVILTLDILSARQTLKSNKRNYKNPKFVKGTGVASGVESVKTKGLFIEDIVPRKEYKSTGEATFSDFDNKDEKRKKILSGMEEYFKSVKEDKEPDEKVKMAKAARAREILFPDRDKLADDSRERFVKENQIHTEPRSALSDIKKPPQTQAIPDIKSAGTGFAKASAGTDKPTDNGNIEVSIKKAEPKPLTVVFPPQKEFDHNYIEGDIIDGDSFSRQLYSDKPKNTKDPISAANYDFSTPETRVRRFTEKGYEPLPEPVLPPTYNDADIIVGDYFKPEKKSAPPQIKVNEPQPKIQPQPLPNLSPLPQPQRQSQSEVQIKVNEPLIQPQTQPKPNLQPLPQPQIQQQMQPKPQANQQVQMQSDDGIINDFNYTEKLAPMREADKLNRERFNSEFYSPTKLQTHSEVQKKHEQENWQKETAAKSIFLPPDPLAGTNTPDLDGTKADAIGEYIGTTVDIDKDFDGDDDVNLGDGHDTFDFDGKIDNKVETTGKAGIFSGTAFITDNKSAQQAAAKTEDKSYGRAIDVYSGEKPAMLRLNLDYAKRLSGNSQHDAVAYSDYLRQAEPTKPPAYNTPAQTPAAQMSAVQSIVAQKTRETTPAATAIQTNKTVQTTQTTQVAQAANDDYDALFGGNFYDSYGRDITAPAQKEKTADESDKEYANKNAGILDRANSGFYVQNKQSGKAPVISSDPAITGGGHGQTQPPASFEARIGLLQKKIDPKNQISVDTYIHESAEDDVPQKPKRERYLGYVPPTPDLLVSQSTNVDVSGEDVGVKAAMLEDTLKSLGIPAKVIGITRGPSVTRFELEMPSGVQVSRIMNTSKDIAYALASKSGIRIEAPIPGRRAIGIEVPNDIRGTVGLRDLIDNPEFVKSSSYLTLSIGKDIGGKNTYGNLEKMPHLLIAGATGSGESPCLHSLLISILYKASPADVRLILIDPKRVEFTDYSGLPHMLIKSVINEREHAINAFKWVQEEMEARYKLLARAGARNIQEYNMTDDVREGEAEKMPSLVVVVDELSDLMHSSYKKEMEGLILSISQKARASGVHLILATQRPSVDVITGTIKINLPSQIALTVNNFADSKTILDQGGAEKLLGFGDLLYSPMEAPEPKRIQGAFVTSKEVKNIVSFIKSHNVADFYEDAEVLITKAENQPEDQQEDFGDEDDCSSDPLLEEVCRKVIETSQASTSMIQRRFKVGYARAARIVDQMEQLGFIGPLDPDRATKRREIYITKEMFKDYFGKE